LEVTIVLHPETKDAGVAAMNITAADIERLKRELEDDLSALQRVESIFAKRNSNNTGVAPTIHKETAVERHTVAAPSTPEMPADLVLSEPGAKFRGVLRGMIIDAIKDAGPEGIRPKDIVAKVEAAGYPFKNRDVLASVVSTCVQRLWRRDDLVEKTADRTYVWK
jgi:hypothetical protein